MSLFSVFHSRRMFLENVMLQGLGILFCDLQCNSKQCGFNPTEQPQNPGDLCINACIYTSVLSFWSVDQCAELVVLGRPMGGFLPPCKWLRLLWSARGGVVGVLGLSARWEGKRTRVESSHH